MLISFQGSRRAASQISWQEAASPSGLGMSPRLDPLTFQFAVWAGKQTAPSADIGCGTGIATAAALVRGARVIAVDPDTSTIQPLLARLPVQQYARVQVLEGRLPGVSFESSSLGAVHLARVLHMLEGASIRESLHQFRDWLREDGKLFISVLTPQGDRWSEFKREYARRCAVGQVWPGAPGPLEEGESVPSVTRRPHLLDRRVLQRELTRAGFETEWFLSFPLSWDASQICCGVIATPRARPC